MAEHIDSFGNNPDDIWGLAFKGGKKITPLGRYIRRLRVENDITLLEMSKALGMNPSELCGIETGDIEKPRFFEAAVAQYFSGLNIPFDCLKLFALDGQKGNSMIQITETQARIFSKLICKIISDYDGVNDAFVVALKVLRNEIDGKIAESELEQEQEQEKQNEVA